YRGGRGNLADVLAARNALILLDDRASEVARQAGAARFALARWIGDAADAPLAGEPAIDAIRIDPRTLDEDLAHHPEIAVLARKEDMAFAEVRGAQASKEDSWSVAVMQRPRG